MAEANSKTAWVWGLKVLAVFAVFTVISTALFVGGFRNSGSPEESAICERNLEALASAAKLYAAENGGMLPGEGWDKALAPHLFDETALSCPRIRRVEPTESGYAMNSKVAGRRLAELKPGDILFFDHRGTGHGAVASVEQTPILPRHRSGRANSVVYVNGKSASIQ